MPAKRIVIALCVFVVLLSLSLSVVACGADEATTTTAPPATGAPTAGASGTETPATTAPAGGGTDTTAAATGEVKTLKIGAVLPLTRELSIIALAFLHGYEMYAEVVNEQGGVQIGADTYKLEIIAEDSKLSAEGASMAATKLVEEDKVQFVVGGIMEPELAAIYQVTEPAGVLFAAANINIPKHETDASADKDLFVRLAVSPDDDQGIDLDYLQSAYPNAKRIALAQPDIGYEPMAERLTAQAAARGMEVVYAEKFAFGTTDFVPIYTNLIASKPDVIFAMNNGMANDQLKCARQLGFKGPFISNSPLGADVFVVTVQDPVALTDVICNSLDVTHPTPELEALMARWQANWPNDPFVSDCVHAYDMPWTLVQAMQKAGSTDSAAVMAALETMTNPGDLKTNFGDACMGGLDRFGANRVLYRPFPITRIMNGELEFIGLKQPVAD